MAQIPFKLADIGEGIAEVEVMQWFVQEGDTVEQFQNVCEVQSDKATVEITSRYDGVVTKIHYDVGAMAQVGSTLIDVEVDDAVAEEALSPTDKKKVPKEEDQVESKKEDIQIKVAAPVDPAPAQPSSSGSSSGFSSNNNNNNHPRHDEKVLTTPSVRRLAKEHQIDLEDVVGTGKDGRLLKSDLLDLIKSQAQTVTETTRAQTRQDSKNDNDSNSKARPQRPSYLDEDTVVPIQGLQRIMVKTMNASMTIPHFGYADEVDMDALHGLREQLKPLAQEREVPLSYLPFIIKASSLALRQYPMLNASVSECVGHMTMWRQHNIAVAMDTPRGLLVPSIKNVESKSIFDIASDLQVLQRLAQSGKLGEAELSGGTFSISNIGSLGGTYMRPIILPPQVVIGALGTIQRLPRFDSLDNVVPTRVMNVSWSGDHRVIDGATMARFSNLWKSYLEEPVTMLTDLK